MAMQPRLTVICENTVGKPVQTIGEHGFSCLIETDTGRYLFDTGQGQGIVPNARLLQVDLSRLDGIILSHGHFDHGGGLLQVLEQCGKTEIHAHPAIFTNRFWVGRYERRANGLPFQRQQVEAAGGSLVLSRAFRQLAPGIWLSGEVPAHDPTRHGDPALQCESAMGDLVQDPLADDLSVLIESRRGPVLLTGCAHAGLPDIIRHMLQHSGHKQLYAVIGGLHLAPASDSHFTAVVTTLRAANVQRIGVAHCTGMKRSAELHAQFPEAVFFANVGSTFDL